MKILFVTTSLGIGGAERMMINLINFLLKNNFQVYILVLNNSGEILDKSFIKKVQIKFLNINKYNFFNPLISYRIIKFFFSHKPNIIQGWMYHGNILAYLIHIFLKPFFKTKIFWSVRQTLYNIKQEKILTRIIIKLNCFFSSSISSTFFNSLVSISQHEKYGFKNCKYISNSIDTNYFKYNESHKILVRKKLDIKNTEIVIIHIARFHPMKNHISTMKILDNLNFPNCRYIFIGKNINLSNKYISTQFSKLENKDKFILLDKTNNINKYLCASDILIMNSKWGEGFPNVIAEAMLTNNIVLSSDIGDSRLIVSNFGLIFKDEIEFQEKLYDVVNNLNYYNKKFEGSQNHIVSNFSEFKICSKFIAEYLS
tara:strand:- start:4957 stop:6066 length:1110 start_codon:yes stop_codon:yes gene_type:complete